MRCELDAQLDEIVRSAHGRFVDARSDAATASTIGNDLDVCADDRHEIAAIVRSLAPLLAPGEVHAAVDAVLARARGIGRLDALLDDDAVSEIMVNGDGAVWIERSGELQELGTRLDHDEVNGIIERITAPLGLHVDRNRPMVDARLPDGSRVHAIVPPVSIDGPCLTIRRFSVRDVPLGEFCGAAVRHLLEGAVRSRVNILVSGGTGAGKTTLLNALGSCIDRGERIVTIEDTAELRLPGEHVVRLEARPPGPEGDAAIDLGSLVRTALRMRPDRIVVGETRGAEALAVLQAMNTGHEGSLSTIHANSPADALRRLETLVLSAGAGLPLHVVREHVHASVDLVVQVARRGGRRSVIAVDEVEAAGALASGAERAVQTRPIVRGGDVVGRPQRPRCEALR